MKNFDERLIFEIKGEKDSENYFNVEKEIPLPQIDSRFTRNTPPLLPSLSERSVVKHFVHLSEMNTGVDHTFYPLGSCTMKYNPRFLLSFLMREEVLYLHPFQPERNIQGSLEIMKRLEDCLCEITGMDAVSLMPSAGAHGEFTGLLIIKKYLRENGKEGKFKIIVPDTSHGTNPASCSMAGFVPVVVCSGKDGYVLAEDVEKILDDDIAGIMLTNPNTYGIFERDFKKIAHLIHSAGGLVYMDGANLNAFLGRIKPGEIGADIIQINLHKTFSTPHGGGGPGSGPVAVKGFLEEYLPGPRIVYDEESKRFRFQKREKSIGMVRAFPSHFPVALLALAYIINLGGEGLKKVSETAVLNARYLREKLKVFFHLPFSTPSLHEFVITDKYQREKNGVTTLDIAKSLLDRGFHPPTIYFPITLHGAMMIEPTETESKETLDAFIRALIEITSEEPEKVKSAPHSTPRRRLDEVQAARNPILRFKT